MPANPYSMSFSEIPFTQPSTNMFSGLGGTPQQAMAALGPAYQEGYQNYLNFNKALGQTTDSGYENAMTQQLAQQNALMAGIDGYGQSTRNDITAAATKNEGDMMQSMISRGLGNFTVMDSGKRAVASDRQRNLTQLDDQIAAMKANYRNQFIGQNTSLAGARLGFRERMSAAPPNAAMYGQLAQQFGAGQQGRANQRQIQDSLGQMNQPGGMRSAGGGIGGGGQGRAQTPSSFGGYSGYLGPQATGGGAFRGQSPFGGYSAASSGYGLDPSSYYANQNSGGGMWGGIGDWASGISNNYIDDGAYGWAAGPNQPSADNYGTGSGGFDDISAYGDTGWNGGGGGFWDSAVDYGSTGGGDWGYDDSQFQQDMYDYSYDPSQDFSDGQWAGADWAYID